MTTPRIASQAQRTFERAERLAMKLYSFACAEEAAAEKDCRLEQAKAWWVIRQAAAEAVAVAKASRGAPGQGKVKAEFKHHGKLKPEEPWPPAAPELLDHQGVPPAPAEKE